MKKLLTVFITVTMMFVFSSSYSQNNTSSHNSDNSSKLSLNAKKNYQYWEITPMGGVLFPITAMSESFEISARAGLDITYRINREVGIYGNFAYNMLTSKLSSTPNASYLSYTVGPRYYFTNPKLKSTLFLEAGVGGYTFTQDAYTTTDPNGMSQNFPGGGDTRFGFNAGIGGDVFLSDNVSLMLKTKYNVILGDNTNSFIGVDGGVNIRF
jgi:opacity protein-like surface antigen